MKKLKKIIAWILIIAFLTSLLVVMLCEIGTILTITVLVACLILYKSLEAILD